MLASLGSHAVLGAAGDVVQILLAQLGAFLSGRFRLRDIAVGCPLLIRFAHGRSSRLPCSAAGDAPGPGGPAGSRLRAGWPVGRVADGQARMPYGLFALEGLHRHALRNGNVFRSPSGFRVDWLWLGQSPCPLLS